MDKKELINLDECVLNALDLFTKNKLPNINVNFKRPLIVGSGNAAITGKIIFQDIDGVFCDESNYLKKLETIKDIDGCVIISASGGKHSPEIAKEVKKRKLKSILITNNPNSETKKFVDFTYVFVKNVEPYTYNTSTYLGMILSKTKEDPKKIIGLIEKVNKNIPKDLFKYDSFFIIVPERFEAIRDMYLIKFDELFGSKISGRAFTFEQAKHSKTIIPNDKELFISIGEKNNIFGKKRLNIVLPKEIDYGTMLCIGYFIIGKIQEQNKPYFKDNIGKYVKETSKIFNEKIDMLVR